MTFILENADIFAVMFVSGMFFFAKGLNVI